LVVGLIGAGEMGSAIGARLRAGGARVVVALEGRSERTRSFATDAGLEDVGDLATMLVEADVILSIVPPAEAARAVDAIVASAGSDRPLVADLNAIAPAAARDLARTLARAGLDLVDGSISGPPPSRADTTRIYLSGSRADEVAALPLDGVERVVVGSEVGLASAVKMSTASVYKGRVAVLAQALRAAHANGVLDPVLDDLVETGLADRERTAETLARASAKAWRYVDEMRQIAATQASVGLPPELFEAFAVVYAGLAEQAVADAPEQVGGALSLVDVLERLNAAASGRAGAEVPSGDA
jgi:3-hydroxyisobutyrate dehydrogenase-like beta-hydroxyacid dehydrogenase